MRKVKEKKSRGFQIFGIILSVLLVVALGFTVFEIFTLNVLPTNLLVPVVLILVILSLIVILLVNFVSRKLAGKIFFIAVSTCDDGRIRLGQLLSLYDR